MKTYFNSMLINQKIWAGFTIVLLVLLSSTVFSSLSLQNTKVTVNSVVNESQPLVIKTHEFYEHLVNTSSALSEFLLIKSEKQKNIYQSRMQETEQALAKISAMPYVQKSVGIQQRIQGISADFQVFKQYKEKILALSSSRFANEIALAYAVENINPHSNTILSSLTTMIDSEMEEDTSDARKEWLNELHGSRYNFQKLVAAVRLYLSTPELSNKENMVNILDVAILKIKALNLNEELYNFEQEDLMINLNDSFTLYNNNISSLIQKNDSDKRLLDVYLMKKEVLPLLNSMNEKITSLVSDETQVMNTSSQKLLSSVSADLTLQIIIAILGLLFGVIVAIFIIKVVAIPLKETVRALQNVARGDGDLTQRLTINSTDELGDLAIAFNQFVEKLQNLLLDVNDCSMQLASASEKMDTVVSSTQNDINSQHEKIAIVSNSIEAMAEKAKDVLSHTSEATELVAITNKNAIEGTDIVSHSVDSSQSLVIEMETATDVINGLETDAQAIGSVLDVIRSIAEQTNLLALNAAIEAARAGEQGRGFAVVADEVRSLASRTQNSTDEIQEMTQRLQSASSHAVTAVGKGTEQSNIGLKQVSQAGELLQNISAAIEEILTMNTKISSVSDQQVSTTIDVNKDVQTINELSANTSKSTLVMHDTSKHVNELSAKLQVLMQQFKT